MGVVVGWVVFSVACAALIGSVVFAFKGMSNETERGVIDGTNSIKFLVVLYAAFIAACWALSKWVF